MKKRTAALVVSGAALVTGVALASPAQAQSQTAALQTGRCSLGNHEYELLVRERARTHVEFEVDRERAGGTGDRWRVQLFLNGNRIADVTRAMPRAGYIEIERNRANAPGRDVVRAIATNLATGETCSVTRR